MHEEVIDVLLFGLLVGFCSEADQAVLEEENAQRVDSEEEHVDPQIELQVVYQERVRNVLLGNHVVVWTDIIGVSYEEDPLALAQVLWLYNERLVLESPIIGLGWLVVRAFHGSCVLFKLHLELIVFDRENKRLREKVILSRELLLHLHQIACQLALVGHDSDARELGYPLVRLYFGESLTWDWVVEPSHVEVWRGAHRVTIDCSIVLVTAHRRWKELDILAFAPEVQLLRHSLDYRVESIDEVHDQTRYLLFLH